MTLDTDFLHVHLCSVSLQIKADDTEKRCGLSPDDILCVERFDGAGGSEKTMTTGRVVVYVSTNWAYFSRAMIYIYIYISIYI